MMEKTKLYVDLKVQTQTRSRLMFNYLLVYVACSNVVIQSDSKYFAVHPLIYS